MLMSALQDENQILIYMNRTVDERMLSNEKLRDDKIAKKEDVVEDDYIALCQGLLQKRSDIKSEVRRRGSYFAKS